MKVDALKHADSHLEPSWQSLFVKFIFVGSVAVNLVLAAVLVFLAARYELIEKASRVFFEEARIPFIKPRHELNRNYAVYRAVFSRYQDTDMPVLVLGDSHTSQLDWDAWSGSSRVAARGIPGDTSAGLLARLGDYTDFTLDRAIVWIGTNDLLAGVAPRDTVSNTMSAAAHLRSQGVPEVMVLGIMPFAKWVEGSRSLNSSVSTINNSLKEACREQGVVFVDPANALTDGHGFLSANKTSDGIHLSADGYEAVTKLMGL